jgi:hypothetical protein
MGSSSSHISARDLPVYETRRGKKGVRYEAEDASLINQIWRRSRALKGTCKAVGEKYSFGPISEGYSSPERPLRGGYQAELKNRGLLQMLSTNHAFVFQIGHDSTAVTEVDGELLIVHAYLPIDLRQILGHLEFCLLDLSMAVSK